MGIWVRDAIFSNLRQQLVELPCLTGYAML